MGRKVICTLCGGTGRLYWRAKERCFVCLGSGKDFSGRCGRCDGTGQATIMKSRSCHACSGKGLREY